MRRAKTELFALLIGLLVCGCAKERSQDGPVTEEQINHWIYEQMSVQYLYNDYIKKQVVPDYGMTCAGFFQKLLSPLPTDNDGKHANGKNYFYSYMERNVGTKGLAGNIQTYGIDFQKYHFLKHDFYAARILYVVPSSPAARAGLRRGEWIRKVNGVPLTPATVELLRKGSTATWSVGREQDEDIVDLREVRVDAAQTMQVSPILIRKVFTDSLSQKRIGYLVYNAFEPGPGNIFDHRLKNAFVSFAQQQVDELILDLRYNQGGYLTSCQLLCSMLAPQSALGKVFNISKYNAELDAQRGKVITPFFSPSEMEGFNVNLSRLYVLTGPATASASEVLINNLRPYMPVCVVGTVTEGKNVGSVEITSSKYAVSLYPLVLKSYNRDEKSEFQNGFEPDIPANELQDFEAMRELGDRDEFLLHHALEAIGQSPAIRTQNTTACRDITPIDSPVLTPRLQGIISSGITPEE